MVEREVVLMKPKHQFIYPNKVNELWHPIFKEKRLLCESMFIPIKILTLILKLVEKEVFPMKPKHQYCLSQWVECVYAAKSLKERRLLCESMFIAIDRRTLIPKNEGKLSFCYETKASIHLSRWGEWIYVPNH